VRSALLVPGPGTGQSVLYLTLTRAQTRRFAALTRQISGLENPRDQLAVIADGRLITHPAIDGAITGGRAQIVFATRAQAESLLPPGPNRCRPLPLTGSAAPGHPGLCQ
jgi:preprotein translocase subunit SecD